MFLIFFLLSFCYCNPTTCLSEAALGYMALDILQRNNIETISINDNDYKLEKFKNQVDYVNNVWEANSQYKLNFKDNYNDWQSTFDKVEQNNINTYIKGNDRVYYSVNKDKYAIIEPSGELEWKVGKGDNQKLSVNFNNMFTENLDKTIKYSNILNILSSTINKIGNDNEKKIMNSLLDTISDKRMKKLINTGHFAASITEEKANEIAKNNKFSIIKASVGSGKNDRFCIDLNGNDLEKIDFEKTFNKNSDIKKDKIDEDKVENAKKYFKIGANDKIVNEVKDAILNNLDSKARSSVKEHASLIKFTKNKNFIKIDNNSSNDSKIKSISCKV